MSCRPPGGGAQGAQGPVALVLAGGELPPPGLAGPLLEGAGVVIAADGGLRHAATLSLAPDLLVGDLDSVTRDLLMGYPGLSVERHERAKDELDLELALSAAQRLGARSARVLGAFGGRLDQSFAALLIAARLAADEPPFPVSLHGGTHEARLCTPGLPCEAAWPAGTTVSLLALRDGTRATATGLAYAVDGLELRFGVGLGVSNLATDDRVVVRCESGVLAVVAEHGVA